MADNTSRCTTRAQRKARFNNTAAGRVIGTVELVENIILHMRIRDILVNANRVCALWHKIIRECPEIQRALFFQPLPGGFLKPYTYEINPRSAFMKDRRGQFWAYDDSGPAIELLRNPFLKDLGDCEGFYYQKPGRLGDRYDRKYEAIERDGASWRRMLLTQPPIRQIKTHFERRLQYVSSYYWFFKNEVWTNVAGITLDDMHLPWNDWRWCSESMQLTPETGNEIVCIERLRPSEAAKTEEPNDLNGVQPRRTTDEARRCAINMNRRWRIIRS